MKQPEQCCGFGGTFSIKFGEISAHIADASVRTSPRPAPARSCSATWAACSISKGACGAAAIPTTRVLHVAQVLAGDA